MPGEQQTIAEFDALSALFKLKEKGLSCYYQH